MLFCHWSFELWDRVGPALGLLLSLTIFFAMQVPLSLWWLERHEREPIEMLRARLTYGRGSDIAIEAANTAQTGLLTARHQP